MVTHPAMENEMSASAFPGGDSEHAELLALTLAGAEDDSSVCECVLNGTLPVKSKDDEEKGIVSQVFREDSPREETVELEDKEVNEVTLTLTNGKDEDQPPTEIHPHESIRSVALQVFIPFLCAGLGTVVAGLILDKVQHWPVFVNVSELFILVPALLGLKGNLEMTLASRLSTQANLGNLDTSNEQWKIAGGNLALVQCQAIVVGFLASVFAIVVDWINARKFDLNHAVLLCASALITASIASVALGIVTMGIVVFSRKFKINPDNVSTPIAASLGDMTTLGLLAGISALLFQRIDVDLWLAPSLVVVFLLLIPLWGAIARGNKYTEKILYSGWIPVISAVLISSVGGCILDYAVERFSGLAVFQPVINGVGGNLVAVQASRISTYLHQRSEMGTLPANESNPCINPCSVFFGKHAHAKTARLLLFMALPGHILFAYVIRLLNAGHTSLTFLFLVIYLTAALLQVTVLLYTAHCLIHWMWRWRIDPDNSAIPYLTALGDLLGTALLAAAFQLLYVLGEVEAQ